MSDATHGNDLKTLFARHGLRCTKQRQVVYGALAASTSHPTADELFLAVRDTDAGISLATVYNTLESLSKCGLCRKLAPTAGGPTRFDATTSEHVHLLTSDGRLMDVPDDLSARLIDRASDPELIAEIERRLGVGLDKIDIQLIARG
ncbi:MAG: transcriptional repressor [Planctomycetota bacterium]